MSLGRSEGNQGSDWPFSSQGKAGASSLALLGLDQVLRRPS